MVDSPGFSKGGLPKGGNQEGFHRGFHDRVMEISRIEKIKQSRYRITLDEEITLVLYRGEIRKYGIEEGGELPEESYREIMEEVLPRRAKLRAMNLLQSKSYTVAELGRKLKDGGYPEGIAEEALAYVASYGYTDDVRYAADYIRYHGTDRGKSRLAMELGRKGVSAEDFAKAWQECLELGLAGDENSRIRELLEKKKYDPDMDIKEKQKIMAFLLRRGYAAEQVRREMKFFEDF